MATNPVNDQAQPAAQEPPATCPMKALREAPRCPALLDKESAEFLAHSHATYARLRAEGAVVRTGFGRGITDEMLSDTTSKERLFVTRYDEAVEALLDPRLSSDFRTGLAPEQRERLKYMPEELKPLAFSLLMLDPPDHTRLRKLVQPNFTARAMELLRPRIQRIADTLLDEVERKAADKGEAEGARAVDLLHAFAYPMPITVISDMLGIPEEDRPQVHAWAEGLLDAENQAAAMDAQRRASMRAFSQYLDGLFERKRREPTEDMISQMVHVQDEGDTLSHQEMVSMVFILFFAGHVTTVNLIGNGVVALLTHPEQHTRFLADPAGHAKGLVEETLRYWGPVDYMSTPRTLKDDMELAGVHIAQGDKLSVGLASANRDPAHFPEPDAFDMTRANAHRNIAFGKGIHVCIGAPLARLEAQIAFETLFRRYPKLRLAVPFEQLRWNSGTGLRGFTRVPVLF